MLEFSMELIYFAKVIITEFTIIRSILLAKLLWELLNIYDNRSGHDYLYSDNQITAPNHDISKRELIHSSTEGRYRHMIASNAPMIS